MQEKFSVVIEAVTNGFKSKMNEIKNVGEQTTVKMAQLKREISSLKSEMKYTDPGSRAFREYAVAIDGAEKELKQLSVAQKSVNKHGNIFGTMGTGIDKMGHGIRSATSRVIRYGLAILSIRTVFSLVSKAAQAYLSQDTDLANKLQSAWAGLGAFLAPLIEWIANKILKLVKYMNIFIKAVTGQDLLAKASAKATKRIKDQTKATKALNKSLTEMDEITNIMDQTGGAEKDTPENPFANFDDIEVDTKWADKIRKFGKWFKENWPYVIAGIIGFATALKGLDFILKGGSFASFGRVMLGIGLIIVGVAGAIYNLKKYIDDINKGLENTKKGWQDFGRMVAFVGVGIAGLGIAIASIPVAVAGAILLIEGLIISKWEDIKKWTTDGLNWIQKKFEGLFGKTLGDIIFAPFKEVAVGILNKWDGIFTGVKKILTGIIKIVKGDFKNGIKEAFKGVVNVIIGVLNGLISGINIINTPLRAAIKAIGKAGGKDIKMDDIKIPKIPKLDIGTNYVPEDQLAYIHKGEAVVPKKFNSAEYFNNMNDNTETNNLLLEVNKTLIDILEKPSTFEVNGKELARTTYNDFKQEGNRLGQSSVVNVR